jgi:dihydrofolate synthase/folylpolyglutamate synthase
MNERELQALYSLRNEYRSLKYDLRNIRTLSEELGSPEGAFRSVLVAGTNGKGSVAWWLSRMLPSGGLYVSPHLEQLNERISIGGRLIDDQELESVAREVAAAVDRASGRLQYPPTYFERVTAMAFCYFRDRARYVVLEVGMGGRLDATNLVRQDVSVITNIGLDHQEHLGIEPEAIAGEKAGIIKDREPVIVGPRCEFPVIRDRARDRLVRAGLPAGPVRELGDGYYEFDLETPVRRYRAVRPGLRGRHQIENAVVAIRAGEALEAAGWPVDETSIARSITTSIWPGRLERLSDSPPVLLDGAHNVDAANALAEYLGAYHPKGVTMVYGAMTGKDWGGMLRVLAPHASTVILTRPDNERAVGPGELAGALDRAIVAPDSSEALATAFRLRGEGEAVLVTGSLYLVGEVRAMLAGERARAI